MQRLRWHAHLLRHVSSRFFFMISLFFITSSRRPTDSFEPKARSSSLYYVLFLASSPAVMRQGMEPNIGDEGTGGHLLQFAWLFSSHISGFVSCLAAPPLHLPSNFLSRVNTIKAGVRLDRFVCKREGRIVYVRTVLLRGAAAETSDRRPRSGLPQVGTSLLVSCIDVVLTPPPSSTMRLVQCLSAWRQAKAAGHALSWPHLQGCMGPCQLLRTAAGCGSGRS